MKVLIIGSGNVATVLGRLIKNAGHKIIQVISRNSDTVEVLANELECKFTSDFKQIDTTADLYIVAMSDAALNGLHETISLGNKIIVHTAGAVSKDVLKDVANQYGVLYPLQSLLKENTYTMSSIPLLIDGNNENTIDTLRSFAKTISDDVAVISESDRLKLHVAAVVVNNFTNHLYTLAADFCEAENVPFNLLYPLIETTSNRLKEYNPGKLQTGPAVRKDIVTLDKHLRLLNSYPKLRSIYLKMSDSIMNG